MHVLVRPTDTPAQAAILSSSELQLQSGLQRTPSSSSSSSYAQRRYVKDDIRISVVYRARCFRDPAEVARWAAENEKQTEIGLETILSTLAADLVFSWALISTISHPFLSLHRPYRQ